MPITNLSPIVPASEIDPAMAKDVEFQEADKAHLEAVNPHPQYRNFNPSTKAVITSQGAISATGDFAGYSGLEIQSDPNIANSAAFLWLYRPSIGYGIHFGLDATNQLGIGGGGMGQRFYRIFHEGNFVTVRSGLPPSTVGGSSSVLGWNPTTGATEFCNYPGLASGGDAYSFFRMPGNTGGVPSAAHKIARVDFTGAYLSTSDQRLKKNFSQAPGLDILLKLSPKKYEHGECVEIDGKKLKLGDHFQTKIGFLAQEVVKILPEAVGGNEKEIYSIDYNCLVTVAVKALQELHELIRQQQREINELRTQLGMPVQTD